MKKSTKGAFAAAAAGVLLVGGAGSLAFWNDTFTVGAGTINSGHLTLDDTTVGPIAGTGDDGCGAALWTLDSAGGATAFDQATDKIVPGDVLTKVCTYKISASGNHLSADLTTSGAVLTDTSTTPKQLAPPVTKSSSFIIGLGSATNTATITSANNNNTLTATIKLTFPYGAVSDNTSQDGSLNLTNYVVLATQTHTP